MTVNKFIKMLAGAILVTGVLIEAKADDQKVDPSGTYVWVMPGRNGGPDRTNTLVLNLKGDNLTGKLTAPARGGQITTLDISAGKVNGTNVTFSLVRTFNDNTVTNNYSGAFVDGSIKGKIEFERDGETQTRDWQAKKQ